VRHNLSPPELDALMSEPFVSTLATYRRDGSVLLSPVWHAWRDGGVDICLGRGDVKLRHVQRDQRASLVVYDQQPPYRGAQLNGTPRVLESDAADYATVLRRIAVHYVGEQKGNAYADASPGTGVILRLEPGDVRSWDFADDFGSGSEPA
jgi:PPOX class probable F420-dependent enzyme